MATPQTQTDLTSVIEGDLQVLMQPSRVTGSQCIAGALVTARETIRSLHTCSVIANFTCRTPQSLCNSKTIHACTIAKTPIDAYNHHPPKQANIKTAHVDHRLPSLHGYLEFLHHALNRLITSIMHTGL